MILKLFPLVVDEIQVDPTPSVTCKCGCGKRSQEYHDGYQDGTNG